MPGLHTYLGHALDIFQSSGMTIRPYGHNWRVTILGNVLTRQTKVRGLKAGSVTQSEC